MQNQQGECICSSESTGFKIMLHDSDEYPQLAAFGQNVLSGYHLDLKISQIILNKINEPAGRCLENDDPGPIFYYPGSYTTEVKHFFGVATCQYSIYLHWHYMFLGVHTKLLSATCDRKMFVRRSSIFETRSKQILRYRQKYESYRYQP